MRHSVASYSYLGLVVLDLHGLLELVHGALERGLLLVELLHLLGRVNQTLEHKMGGDLVSVMGERLLLENNALPYH